MLSDHINGRSPISYPSLRTFLTEGGQSLEGLADLLERSVHHVFGGHHQLLTAEQRRLRLDIWKLSNLMHQMDALEDVEIFALAFRCPEQVKRYDRAIQALLDLAQRRELDEATIGGLQLVLARLWQVRRAVTPFTEGLS